ncbi:hypothetical protein PC118_g19148 [Phytophthora cactorum]|uniref:Uncharacterized protein n=1 Tax=Phytophthora cactorum TaxID=29920 RepID=A0A8T0YKS1_9STRA|nr:hypothetical protein PC113_g19059 [Phytophthora cactorum]KAG2906132.1 hypothetical protein PC117_g20582 [Phytophthora cactorum]KAG2966485.1 hypothetical protein PC118_g19148 [Phytophthora cactorum]KAG2982035.1 hypothetical protein PC119_g20905 [Phytophthora cactorum]
MSYFALFYSYQIMCYYIYWNMGIVQSSITAFDYLVRKIKALLLSIRIFIRMSPNGKWEYVKLMQRVPCFPLEYR